MGPCKYEQENYEDRLCMVSMEMPGFDLLIFKDAIYLTEYCCQE